MSTDNSVIDELNVYESPEISSSASESIKNFAIAEFLNSEKIIASSRRDNHSQKRQGGNRLQSIFTQAGASAEYARRCPTISQEAIDAWKAEDRTKLNAIDICSWCGILAWSVYKKAGIKMKSWTDEGFRKNFLIGKKGTSVQYTKSRFSDVPVGSIGIILHAPGATTKIWNHHFVVVANDPTSKIFQTVEGNVKPGSTIGMYTRHYSNFDAKWDAFVFPDKSLL